ncbi:MAG: hypothetical protein IKO40_07595 [Kiritimatiellae bacterium]|nr:hypothetical protein [Kiritimatiellia bacterium]
MSIESKIIGMLHIPVNSIIASPVEWQRALGAPAPTARDWKLIAGLRETLDEDGFPRPDRGPAECRAVVEHLSFYGFVRDRMFEEAEVYVRHGIRQLMLENTGAPYFTRGRQEAVIYWLMRVLAGELRKQYPSLTLGIQVLAFSDDWAMDIACRNRFNFIRCESALFGGMRPEGATPNHGNLAQLYARRQELLSNEASPVLPKVYVDLQKKHTVFAGELQPLEPWLANLIFAKLEGIVITGTGTGQPVREEHLRQARMAVDEVKAQHFFPKDLALPLLVGSGVSEANLALCAGLADGLIVGSALKKNGYWECELDETRLANLLEAGKGVN